MWASIAQPRKRARPATSWWSCTAAAAMVSHACDNLRENRGRLSARIVQQYEHVVPLPEATPGAAHSTSSVWTRFPIRPFDLPPFLAKSAFSHSAATTRTSTRKAARRDGAHKARIAGHLQR